MFADLETRKESVKQADRAPFNPASPDNRPNLDLLECPSENYAFSSNASLNPEETKTVKSEIMPPPSIGIIQKQEKSKPRSKGPFEEVVERDIEDDDTPPDRQRKKENLAMQIQIQNESSEPSEEEKYTLSLKDSNSRVAQAEPLQSVESPYQNEKKHLESTIHSENISNFSTSLKVGKNLISLDSTIDKNIFESCPGRLSAEQGKFSRKLPSSFAFSVRKGPNHYLKIKSNKKSEHEFKNLYLSQTLYTKTGAHIRVMKFNFTGQFLAAGTNDGYLWVWRLSDQNDEDQDFQKLIEPVHHIKANLHSKGILDMSWSSAVSTKILTCGLDKKVVLFDIKNGHLIEFPHQKEVTSVDFLTDSVEFFISGTIHGYVRLWNVGQKKPIDYHALENEAAIHTARFTPDNRQILVGSEKGLLIVLDHENNSMTYQTRFDLKNRTGATKSGRKLTGFHFLSNTQFLATTADDRIRLFDLDSVDKQLGKYKGHSHRNLIICASASDDQKYVICPSENGKIYIWNFKRENYVPAVNPKWTGEKLTTNQQYESFSPVQIKHPTCALIAPCQVSQVAMKKIVSFAPQDTPLVDRVVLVAGKEGMIEVYFRQV